MEPVKKVKKIKELENSQRKELLTYLEDALELPMLILGFVWLILLILELTQGLSSILENISIAIWIVFIVDFVIKFILAPEKLNYVKSNLLTLIALIVPALRVLGSSEQFDCYALRAPPEVCV